MFGAPSADNRLDFGKMARIRRLSDGVPMSQNGNPLARFKTKNPIFRPRRMQAFHWRKTEIKKADFPVLSDTVAEFNPESNGRGQPGSPAGAHVNCK